MKANPNALELLFSVEQEFVEENGDFERLLRFVRERAGALIRCNWDKFTSAIRGIGFNGIERNGLSPKTLARLLYFFSLWLSLVGKNSLETGSNGEMTIETWRNKIRVRPKLVRMQEELTERNKVEYNWIKEEWPQLKLEVQIQEDDEQKCKEVEEAFKTYFANYLTLN